MRELDDMSGGMTREAAQKILWSMDPKHREYGLMAMRAYGVIPETSAEQHFARVIYDELTDQAQGQGLQLKGGAQNWDDGRWVQTVEGPIDLIALARRMLNAIDFASGRVNYATGTENPPAVARRKLKQWVDQRKREITRARRKLNG